MFSTITGTLMNGVKMSRALLLGLALGLPVGVTLMATVLPEGLAQAQARRPAAPKPGAKPGAPLPPLPLPEAGSPETPGKPGQPPKPAAKAEPTLPEPEYIAGSGFAIGHRGLILTSSILVRGQNCAADRQPRTVAAVPGAAGELSLPALNQRVQASVLQIFSKQGDCAVTVKLPNGQLYPARVLRTNPQAGVALIATEQPVATRPLAVCANLDRNAIGAGEEIAVFGSAYGLPVSMSTGIVNAVRPVFGFNHVQFDAPTNRGVVGGPITDRRGNVVAIFTRDNRSGNQGLTFVAMLPQVFKALNLRCGG
jgi:hypothetical protein